MQKITSFTDLLVWRHGHELVLLVYRATRHFPNIEQYGLSNQMQRSAVSITSNIAEGFSRKTKKEKIQFYYTALGSLTELQNQLLIARDLQYINSDEFQYLASNALTVHKLLSKFIKGAIGLLT